MKDAKANEKADTLQAIADAKKADEDERARADQAKQRLEKHNLDMQIRREAFEQVCKCSCSLVPTLTLRCFVFA